ncbi:DUF1492 domain-containing protein [Lactobacillus sp. ESL0684]|uniref:ArpU family phage packaging/lysis transcriptional regulator n=1 Tax=Lactobacillus sp. ESL0684 TaxID=2983213 RepID=UPI0023F780AC|nr:ArpU family phage packaging/lysis transcriptional regulator [Lactobacillus sp. ESL0684]WEV42977.1 DUF1492 domain-containing protein [Lactobacillus sp. ESL0684]
MEFDSLEQVDINRNKTAEKVRDFLNKDFIHYLDKAGLHKADLSSPQLDPTGVSSHGGNSAEYKMVQIIDYENKCKAIITAIKNCRENVGRGVRNRTILQDVYLKELENWQVQERLGLSEAAYYAKKQAALCEFADRIEVWAVRFGTHIPDLHIYQKEQ